MFRLAAAAAVFVLSAGAGSAQVTPQAAMPWLTAHQGMTPELVTEGEDAFIRVQDESLTWLLFFYGCESAGCDSLQFGAGFTNDSITQDSVNTWNRDRRFLKAYFEAGDEGSAIVQYDVVPTTGAPIGHLDDHLELWRAALVDFAAHVAYFEPAQPAAE